MAAMLAMPFKALAAFSYSGARLLQWPHHGTMGRRTPQARFRFLLG